MLDASRPAGSRRIGPVLLIGLTTLATTGCGGDTGGSRGPDSAPVWSLEPTFDIGSLEDAEASLTRVGDVLLSDGGELYVAQPQDGNIRVHDDSGTLLRTIGRRGEGPGELEGVSGMGLQDDELWVMDPGNQRMTWFTSEGEVLRTRPWSPPMIGTGVVRHDPSTPRQVILRQDGLAVVYPGWLEMRILGEPGGGPTPTPGELIPPIVLIGPDNAILDTVATAEFRTADPLGEGQRSLVRSEPVYSLHPTSYGVVFVRRATVGNPEPGTFRVGHLGADGDTIFSRAYEYSAVPTPAGLVQEYLERLPEERREGIEATLWVPQTLPPVTDLMVGSDGVIWIAREAAGQDSVAWWALDPETGDPLGTLNLPQGHEIRESRGGLIVVHRTDEFDVPYLTGYRVTG